MRVFFVIKLLQYYGVVEIAIRQCRSSGIDCKIHGLAVRGRLRSDDDDADEIAVSAASYLASDGDDDSVTVVDDRVLKNDGVSCRLSANVCAPREILTNVFVWGLNDKDQLGGPKGSKVCHIQVRK